jgi:hypothetical protein
MSRYNHVLTDVHPVQSPVSLREGILMSTEISRLRDGSIDYHFYAQRARTLRAHAATAWALSALRVIFRLQEGQVRRSNI